jgi:hypothetical protein
MTMLEEAAPCKKTRLMRLSPAPCLPWRPWQPVSGCARKANHTRGVYMLVDTSGTYTEELNKAKAIINYLLGTLTPGDTMAIGRIDTGSFSEKDIVAKVTFDQRPSVANTQKRAFQKKVADFVSR